MNFPDYTPRDYAIVSALFTFAALCLLLAWREHLHQRHLRALKLQARAHLNGRPC